MSIRPPKVVPSIAELGGTVVKLLEHPTSADPAWSAFNPSISFSPVKGYALIFRSSNYLLSSGSSFKFTVGDEVRSRVWFTELDDNLRPLNIREINCQTPEYPLTRGAEDSRLYWRGDSWRFLGVVLESSHTPAARLVEYVLDYENNIVTSARKYPGQDGSKIEKNWMAPSNPSPHFDFIYGPSSTIKDNVITSYLGDNWQIGGMRGGSGLLDLEDGTYLAVVHRLFLGRDKTFAAPRFEHNGGSIRKYLHYFARYDSKGRIIEASSAFNFTGANVEFAAGIVSKGSDFVISFGLSDASSHLAIIDKKAVLKTLAPVTDA